MTPKTVIKVQPCENEREHLAAITLQAALVDGTLTLEERALAMDVMETLSQDQVHRVYRKVFFEKADIQETFRSLQGEGQRRKAVELAKSVSLADGRLADEEKNLLAWMGTQTEYP